MAENDPEIEHIGEPVLTVHLTEPFDICEVGVPCEPGAYIVHLCVASALVEKGVAHIPDIDAVNQGDIVNWVNDEGLTLQRLTKDVGVSKAMLSQVKNGKKKLTGEHFNALLVAYARWDN